MLSHLNNGDDEATALQHPNLNIRFLYSTKLPREEGRHGGGSLEQVLFLSRLRQIIASQSQFRRLRISLDLFVTDWGEGEGKSLLADEHEDLTLHTRRINQGDVQEAISGPDGKVKVEETVCYVCGPPGMTDELVESLEGFLGKGQRVYYEKWW